MRLPIALALSSLVLVAGLSACGGSDNGSSDSDFNYPASEGTALPSTLIETLPDGTEVRHGGFGSSMVGHPTQAGYFYCLTDRGPNVATAADVTPSGIIFVEPDFSPSIGLFRLNSDGQAEQVSTVTLKDSAGRPITGLPNHGYGSTGETPYTLGAGAISIDPDNDGVIGYDESGLDPEGLVAMADGTFWVSDEYGPHIVHFAADGKEIERINPFQADPRNKTGRTLPAELAKRWPNRGMEGLTITPDGKTLVGIMQSNLYNPSKAAVGSINLVRIVAIDIQTGVSSQYLYRQDAAGLANSEIVALSATAFLVIERDTKFQGLSTGTVRKNVYKVDLAQATDVSGSNSGLIAANAKLSSDPATGLLVAGKTLEQVIKDAGSDDNFAAGWTALAAEGLVPVTKTLVYDAVASQNYLHDKMEGLWVIDTTHLGIVNDADFAIAPDDANGAIQKKLYDGSIDSNRLYVVTLPTPLY